jgi:broad specificity phosphatase PhoE
MVVRLAAAIERLRATGAQTIVAVSHGGAIYALEAALGAEFERVGNLGGRWFHFDADAGDADPIGAAGNAEGSDSSSVSGAGSAAGLPSGWRLGERVHLLGADEETVPDQL